MKYFDLAPLWRRPEFFKIALSLRSDGKTTQCGKYCVQTFNETGKRPIYMRRYWTEFQGEFRDRFYSDLITIDKACKGELLKGRKVDFKGTERKKELYLTLDGKRAVDFEALTLSGRHKSSYNYETNRHIFFDEYMLLDGSYYRGDVEIFLLMELYKTIDRRHNDTNVVVCGNTIDKYCPLFSYFNIPVEQIRKNKILSFRGGKLAVLLWENAENLDADRDSDIGILTAGTEYGRYNEGGYLYNADNFIQPTHTRRVIFTFVNGSKYFTAYAGEIAGEIVFDRYNAADSGDIIAIEANADRRAIMLRAAPALRDMLQTAKDLNRLKFANEEVLEGCKALYAKLYK